MEPKETKPLTNLSRRNFIKNTGTAALAFSIVPRFTLGGAGFIAPSDTVYIAGIGVGGKGTSDLAGFSKNPHARIIILCDVDDRQALESKKNFPKARYYKDFRVMLDKEHKGIDAVSVSTPDHTHAVAAMAAMERNKHVYVQKPLTYSIYEARMLTEAAKKFRVVTQMGTQYASSDHVRQAKEMVDAGLIGDVTHVQAWTNRPVWPQGIPTPTGKYNIPKELDWDLWLGPAKHIEYNPAYLPFNWRGWWNFGTGALGDMACHIMDPAFRILPIDYPSEVECSSTTAWSGFFEEARYTDSCPASSIIHLKFPRKDGKGDIEFTWMDGGLLPKRPEELGSDEMLGDEDGGYLLIGTKGKLMGDYNLAPVLLPASRMKEDILPKQTIPRIPGAEAGHYTQWVEACMKGYGNMELSSPFEYAGPMTEAVLMGNLALRSYAMRGADDKGYPGRKKLLWDAKNMKITNFDEANQFVKREYRSGWRL
ncbi:MAG: Gfo/Idh/MocA family oxidoreductase [Cyclobacteriaceae bacterium]|nr:Gfo/Idh/MocA family oxidoreductase [Cyclobacteriaceae bacterium]MDH4297567.1 Gfo/Idh/MocA family oxidoreductase [Cyclobacteriaceae bacterium]MDH5247700.1 Gfo/Idh/MocA family oxidoreductase [Cyclobacteriaceae bacterium]